MGYVHCLDHAAGGAREDCEVAGAGISPAGRCRESPRISCRPTRIRIRGERGESFGLTDAEMKCPHAATSFATFRWQVVSRGFPVHVAEKPTFIDRRKSWPELNRTPTAACSLSSPATISAIAARPMPPHDRVFLARRVAVRAD